MFAVNYFHPQDMDKIMNSDEWLQRFLMHHDNDIKDALNMLWDTCHWRKDNQVNGESFCMFIDVLP